METRLLYPITTATNVLVKTGFFKNKTLALVIELLKQNSGGGGNTEPSEPEEIPEGITDFSQAPSDNVVYEGDDYPKGAYTRVTLDQGILYSDLKFVLYSHPFDVYTISQNVVINRVDATINNDITFGEIESFTSPTVWIPQFDNFKSSLPLSTKAIVDGDKTYTFRKIQDSPLGKFGYWADNQEYYSLPEMPVCIFKSRSKLYTNIPETLIKTDIGDDVVLTLSELQEGWKTFLLSLMLGVAKYKGIDLGELDNLIVEIPTNTGTISKKFTELNPIELHNYMSTLELEELELLMSLLNSLSQLDVDEEWLFSSIEVAFLIQGSYALLLIGFHSHWWVSAGTMTGDPDSGSSTVPIVTNKMDASRYERCLIYNKADNVASIGQPVVVLSLLGEMEGTLLLDYFPFSLNNDAVDCVVVLHDVYAVLQPQRSSDLYWVDTDLRYPLRSEDYESIFSQVATGNISLYITRTLYISDGELWNAVGSVDLSDVYSRIGSVESSVSDVNSSVQSLQSIVDNMKSIQYKQINIFNEQSHEYTIESLLYPTLYYVNCGLQPNNSYEQEYTYIQALLTEVSIKVRSNSEYITFSAPVKGEFLVIPYYYSNPASNYSGANKKAIIGINFPIEVNETTKILNSGCNIAETFTLLGSIVNLTNASDNDITVYLKKKITYYYELMDVGTTGELNLNPITIPSRSSVKVQKIGYSKSELVYDSDYRRYDFTVTKEFVKFEPEAEDEEIVCDTYTVNGVLFNMIPVTGGTFQMGSSDRSHPVLVSDYYIGETEITLDLYKAVMGTSSSIQSGYAASINTWTLAQDFINALNAATGKYFRLPTEAEWEYAARGGSKSKGYKYSGSNSYISSTSTHSVKFRKNELGIWDMSEGVREWCFDNYDPAYDLSVVVNPTGPESGSSKVIRGGSWNSSSSQATIAYRTSQSPTYKSDKIGLRLAASVRLNPTEIITVSNVSFKMINVPGRVFYMGTGYDRHPVRVYSFSIAETEVTLELWEAVMGSNPSIAIGSQKPVENVSWEDCNEFISELNNLTGENFRFPTEAEWEFAAGGGKGESYAYSGSDDSSDVGSYSSHNVKTYSPNELGLYDMSGNGYEWCSDNYGPYSYNDLTNPTGPTTGMRVVRGENKVFCRSYDGYIHNGIRLVHPTGLSNTTITIDGVSFNMKLVNGGTYIMGYRPLTWTLEELYSVGMAALPAHKVTLSSYYIGETLVTEALWNAVMGTGTVSEKHALASWDNTQNFISTLNLKTGLNFRLPTEAEWEFAARGGITSDKYTYSGSNNISEVAVYYNNHPADLNPSVKQKLPNELGIYDMSGLCEELCSGDYNSSGEASSGDRYRISKGGNKQSSASNCTIYSRRLIDTDDYWYEGSARVVCTSIDNTLVSASGIEFNMILVEGGTLTKLDGTTVSVNSFYIAEIPITVQLYSKLYFDEDTSDITPQGFYNTYDVEDFIQNYLNSNTGILFRLPTEEEWEFAALGGNLSHNYTYSGSNNINDVAWYSGNTILHTRPVKYLAPNALGLYDMSGNVLEWCSDWYSNYSFETKQDTLIDPFVLNGNTDHVIRGGYSSMSGSNKVSKTTVYYREGSNGDNNIGLRLVLPKEPTITYDKTNAASDWWCTSNLSGLRQTWSYPEEVLIKVNNYYVNITYPFAHFAEIVSGENWENSNNIGFCIPSAIASARTAANPELIIDDLVLKITKGINSFRYVIPGRVVPIHYPVIILAIRDSSLITNSFEWGSSIYGVTLLNTESLTLFAGLHKTGSILVISTGNSVTPYDGDSTFKVYAIPTINHTEALVSPYSNLSVAGRLCICTKGLASIKYMGQELLECLYDNATITSSGGYDTLLTGAKIYITKRRICEDLTGLDINITTE